ncbi:DUF58 domain-containing protein [Halosolutus amylolyticus]|uniref:DUF58 domain-containing protein n=1 Tax=Halosolutus amylolyticus TaxID=2932267 RepID=A0ABD5PKT5_9EURY|nr:DUF58 domain-containing protein [Halosolutus amylolyticus]
MSDRRRLLLGAGLVLFGVAVAEMVVPGLLPVPVGDRAVPITGGLVLLYAVYVRRSGGRTAIRRASTPDPEVRVPTPTPGDDVDGALKQFLTARAVYSSTRTRRGLRAAAITVLTRYGDCTEDEARTRVDEGTWTADPRAAAFLGDTDGPSRTIAGRLRDRVAGGSQYDRNIRHTVDAIAAVADVPTPDRDDGDDGIHRRLGRAVGRAGTRVAGSNGTDRTPVTSTASRSASVAANGGETSAGTTAGTGRSESGPEAKPGIRRSTNHWRGVGLVAFVALGVGLLAEQPAPLLAGIVGIGYAAYARSAPFDPVRLSVERSVSDERPDPGDVVEVTVTITNESPRLLPDVRIVDGVPEALVVTDGSPRYGTALRGGASATFSYTVEARRGRHAFQPTLVVARNLPGTVERELLVTAASTLTCVPPLRPTGERVPLREQVSRYTGAVETDAGGAGVEFHTTRRYQPGDPLNRIDWHRQARTGDLATLEFRQERAATVVLVVDVQSSAYVSPGPEADHAVDRSVAAARRVFARLLDDGHRVGIATMGAADCWLQPGTGRDHRSRGRTLLATDPALSPVPRDDEFSVRWRRRLRRRLPETAQVIVFSPLCDRSTVRSIRQFDAAGHATTVVSPDPTAGRTPGQRLQRVSRRVATTDLRRAGIPVLDWGPDNSLDELLARGWHG